MKLPKISNRNASIISVLIVGCIVFYMIRSVEFAVFFASFIVLAFLWSALGEAVEKVWMTIAKVLSYIMPKILLSFIFYLILTPIALISRIVKKDDPLCKKNNRSSFWKVEETLYPQESFEKMW